jgi:[ribosomal protein S18]-alanine N-acetyltransferase
VTTDTEPGFALSAGGRLRIRAMREDDLARVMEIEHLCFSTPWREATFRNLLKRTDTDLYAAELDGRVVAYAACWTVFEQSELGNVAVAPEARGRGIAGALVDAVVARVRARGAHECFLEVRESNRAAQSVYHDRGFVVVGRRRSYYAQPTEDALVMRLQLDEGLDHWTDRA